MKRFATALLLALMLSSAAGGQTITPPKGAAQDEAAIRALLEKCVEGWNRGSGEGFAAQFAEDSDYVVVNGMHIKGRQQNAASHQQIFDTFYKGTRLWARIKSVRFLRPDVAVVHSVSKILKPGESVASAEPEAIQTWTVSKRSNEWLVDAFHNTPIQRQGAPPPIKP